MTRAPANPSTVIRGIVLRVLGVLFSVAAAHQLTWMIDDRRMYWVSLPICLLVLFGVGHKSISLLLRAVACIHIAVALLAIRIYMGNVEPTFLSLAGYIATNVTLPGLVVGFLRPVATSTPSEDLPPGYEFLDSSRHRFRPMEKLLFIILVSLGAGAFLTGWLVLSIAWLPVLFAAYWLLNIFRRRKQPPPVTQRRVRLAPRMQRPAQTRSHWTVNDSEFDDPELYKPK
jgi:hypothetical protein